MITFKAQHILNPAAKKRKFRGNFKPKLKLQIIPKRPEQYDQHVVKPAARNNLVTFKAQHIVNSAAKKRIFWRNFKPPLQLQIIPKRLEQYDHLQDSTYTKLCSQKMDILAKF